MRFLIVLVLLCVGLSANAQEVKHNGKTYEVKKDRIFHNGEDVTDTFSVEEQKVIMTEFAKVAENIKIRKKEEKQAKKREKQVKKAEKKAKKAEKALKQKEKAQEKLDKARKQYAQAQKKFSRLEKKGKLSPSDHDKWQKKFEKMKANIAKAEKKLKRS